MEELIKWLNDNKIAFEPVDSEVINIPGMGKLFVDRLSEVESIFKGSEGNLKFNLSENEQVLMEEGINYVVFPFGKNWYYYDLRVEFKMNILKYVGKRQVSGMNTEFVNLGVHSPYELLNGSGDIAAWVKKAKMLGHTALGMCDYNTMAGTLHFQKECLAAGIQPVLGYSLTLRYNDEPVEMKVYCQNRTGLGNLLRIHKAIMADSAEHEITISELLRHGQGNVLVLGKLSARWMKQCPVNITKLKEAFDKVYYQIDLNEYKAERIDIEVLQSTAFFFNNFYREDTDSFLVEPVLLTDCYYIDKDDARNKIVLNKILSGAAHRQSDEQYFKDADEHFGTIKPLFDTQRWNVENLFERLCMNTLEIARGATATYETDRNFMPRYNMTWEEKCRYKHRHAMFLSLLEEGFEKLVPKDREEVYRKRLEHEIYILESTDNIDYLLVQYDTVNWARENGILVGCGRGSAGGSLALYLLGITLIDPIRYNLIFERFLLPERAGLYPAKTTLLVGEIPTEVYVELEFENGSRARFDRDARLLVLRDGKEVVMYADELREDDDVIFNHRDLLWTINK